MTKLKHFSAANFPQFFLFWVSLFKKWLKAFYYLYMWHAELWCCFWGRAPLISSFFRSKLTRERFFNEKFLPCSWKTPPTRRQIFVLWWVIFRVEQQKAREWKFGWEIWWEIKKSEAKPQRCGEYRDLALMRRHRFSWLRGLSGNLKLTTRRIVEVLIGRLEKFQLTSLYCWKNLNQLRALANSTSDWKPILTHSKLPMIDQSKVDVAHPQPILITKSLHRAIVSGRFQCKLRLRRNEQKPER